MIQWFYEQAGVQAGPVSTDTLLMMCSRGQLRGDSLVWREGLSSWEPAIRQPELAPMLLHAAPMSQFAGSPAALGYYGPVGTYQPNYAGFWWRVLASLIDAVLLLLVLVPIEIATDHVFGLGEYGSQRTATMPVVVLVELGNFVLQMAVYLLYYGLMEGSAYQATLGKLACGLYVCDAANNRISVGRAMCRYLASILSTLTLGIGYLMGAFTEKKQCLHDIICGTYVIKR